MNGRVYDPVLARFLSPDPYVQAPDYTQGFNRYSYCYNNPFKYSDPSGELQVSPFYLSLNLGYSSGGFSFGISAGVGIENGAYAGISIGYSTYGSFSFSASAGIAGFYVSGGFDTKGGWNASTGWSAPIPSLGIVSFNTNMLGVSGSYSQNGGWSGNYMGMQISQSGVSFKPSVGMGVELYYRDNSIERNSVYSSTNSESSNSENTSITTYTHEEETKVWNYVQKNTKENQKEYAALITINKILVRKMGENNGNPYVGLKSERILGKQYVTYNGERMKLLAILHTHPGKESGADEFSRYSFGKESDHISASNHKGVVYYLMTENGSFRSMIYLKNSYEMNLISNLKIVQPLLDGNIKLIPVTMKIYNHFNK